jgi:sulfofructose kinase
MGAEGIRQPVDVVGLGYCVLDILAVLETPPEFDSPYGQHVSALTRSGGGPVGTALVALARLGVPTGYLGVLGDDDEGRALRDEFVREGVDVRRLRISGQVGTNVCLLLVEGGTGRRAILCHRRVSPEALRLTDADRAYVQAAQVLHLDTQFLPAAIQAARWAREANVVVSLDAYHPKPGLDSLLPWVDWLVVSEAFPHEQTGEDDLERAAAQLLDLGPRLLAVTHGERGCRVWAGGESFSRPAFQVPVVDTTGAGDAFHGGFVYAMLQGWRLRRVVEFASAVAALNCQTLGGRPGLPTLGQVEAFLRQQSQRA